MNEPTDGPSAHPHDPSPNPFLVRVVSSAFGSVLTALAVTPLDVVKVRQQAMQADTVAADTLARCGNCGLFILDTSLIHGERVLQKCTSPHFRSPSPETGLWCPTSATGSAAEGIAASMVPHHRPFPTSTVGAMAHIYRAEGLGGLYAGLAPTLVMAVPATVLYFTAYDHLRESMIPAFGENMGPMLAGTSARVLASAATSPFELIRTLAQSGEQGIAEVGMIQSFRQITASGGVLALWRGLEPTLWRDVPFSGIYWWIVERTRRYLNDRWPSQSPVVGFTKSFISGAFAGMIAAAVTTPFDVIKTRRQV